MATTNTNPKLGYSVMLGLSYGIVALEPGDISQLYFIEDIFSFCMAGKMVFDDRFGILEFGPFTGNERLILAYGETKSKKLIFDIIKFEKVEMTSPTLSTQGTRIVIHFVDTTFRNFTRKKFSKSWKNESNLKIFRDIIKWAEGKGDNDKIILKRYSDTNDKISFVIPYWTLMESISWLNRRTKPKPSQNVGNEIGGYLYYNNTYWDDSETKNKDNNFTAAWMSINALFSHPPNKKKDVFVDQNPFIFSSGDEKDLMYVNKILEWEYDGVDSIDLRKLQGGHMLGYNFDGKTLIDRTYKYTKKDDTEKVNLGMIDTITGLGNKSLFPDISVKDSEILLNGESNSGLLDNMFYHDWLRNYSRQQMLNVVVRGWEGRFAGMMIKELVWKSSDSTETGGNKNLIGPYIIKSITHNWGTKEGYKQRLVLLKNAYYKSDAKALINIGVVNTSTEGSILK